MKSTIKFLLFTVIVFTSNAFSQVPNYVPTNGLVGYWPFNGNANDESGNGNNGTVNGTTLTTDRFGNTNSAYNFDGVDDYVSTNLLGITGQNSRTIGFWFNSNNNNTGIKTMLGYGEHSSAIPQGSRFDCTLETGKPSIDIGYSFASYTVPNIENNWKYYTVTYNMIDGVNVQAIKLFIDGVLQSSPYLLSNSVIINTGNLNLVFFGAPYSTPSGNSFNGKLDDIGIWNRALTQQEITNLYTSTVPVSCLPAYVPTSGLVGYWPFCGNANDESGNGNNGTVNGATLTTDRFGSANSAYYFDYYQDIVTPFNLISGTQSRTISFWMKNSNGQKTITPIWYGGNSSQPQMGAAFNLLFNRNETLDQCGCWPEIQQGIGVSADWIYFLRQYNTGDNQWHFYSFVLANSGDSFSQVQIFVDGVLLASNEIFNYNGNASTTVNTVNNNPLVFGRSMANLGYPSDTQMRAPTEYLDDISIYNRALTPTEITQLYTDASVTPPVACTSFLGEDQTVCAGTSVTLSASGSSSACPTLPTNLQTGLVGYWPFCGNANDESGNGNNGTVNGATLTTDRFGNANSAYSFDGNDNIFSPRANLSSFSVSAWINPSTSDCFIPVVDAYPNSWEIINVCGDGDLSFIVFQPQGQTLYSTNVTLNPNTWYHIGVIYDAPNVKIYVNGLLVLNQNTIPIPNVDGLMNFGASISGNSQYLNGKLDDIAIHNRALTASEIQQLYTLGQTTYLWLNGATTPTINVSPTSTTTYTCTVTTNGASCTDSVTVVVNNPTIDLGNDVTVCGTSTTLTAPTGFDSYLWSNGAITNTTTVTANGTYTCTVKQGLCSATDTIDVVLVPLTTNTTPISACDSYLWNGTTYTTSGVYTGTTTNCVTESLNLTITPSSTNTTPISACDSYSWNGTTYTTSGTYTGTTANCVTESLNLTITTSSTNTTPISACDSYSWNGTTYTTSGTYTGTTANCVTQSLNLTITPSSTNTTPISACDSYVWNGITYSTSGTYTGPTANCVTESLNLTITPSSTNTILVAACGTYTWPNNGQTYTTSGVYTGTTANCVTQSLNLTITPNTSVTTTINANDTYTWAANGITYTASGIYTGPTSANCVTQYLDLTINSSGISEEEMLLFSLYPNPVSDMLYVNFNGQDKQDYLIIDNFGSVVKRGVLGNLINEISVSQLSAGLYYFKIEGTKPLKFSKID